MSPKRLLLQALDRRVSRRLILVPLVVIFAIVGVALSPLLLPTALVVDLVKQRRHLPRVRLLTLILGAFVIETLGICISAITWVLTGFGLFGSPEWRWHFHRRFMGAYTAALLRLVSAVISSRVEWRDTADLTSGPVVLLARHTSFFDAVIPAVVLSHRNRLLAHHVVTHGLRYLPSIDIIGHRVPNRFIKRTPGHGSNELGPIEGIGAVLTDRSAAIIFPEGTFRNPERFERVVRRIRRRQPELADRAELLEHVLPPRANGTFALLAGAPDADVVICANTGLESFGSLRDIIDRPKADEPPIIVETWRIPRADIPETLDEFDLWLFDEYVKIDAWVAAQKTN